MAIIDGYEIIDIKTAPDGVSFGRVEFSNEVSAFVRNHGEHGLDKWFHIGLGFTYDVLEKIKKATTWFKVTIDDEKTEKTIFENVFTTEDTLLSWFYEYTKIPTSSRDSWKGITSRLLAENDDYVDTVFVDIHNGRWMRIEIA